MQSTGRLDLALLKGEPVEAADVRHTVCRYDCSGCLRRNQIDAAILTVQKVVLKGLGDSERAADQLVVDLLLERLVANDRLTVDIQSNQLIWVVCVRLLEKVLMLVVLVRGGGLRISVSLHGVIHQHRLPRVRLRRRFNLMLRLLLRRDLIPRCIVALVYNEVLLQPSTEKLAEDEILRDSTRSLLERVVVEVRFKRLGPGHVLLRGDNLAQLRQQVIDLVLFFNVDSRVVFAHDHAVGVEDFFRAQVNLFKTGQVGRGLAFG